MGTIKSVQLLFLASLCFITFCCRANRVLMDDNTPAKHPGNPVQISLTGSEGRGDDDDKENDIAIGGGTAGSGSGTFDYGHSCCNHPGNSGGSCGEGGNPPYAPPSGGSCGTYCTLPHPSGGSCGTCCTPPPPSGGSSSTCCPPTMLVPCPINCGQPDGSFTPCNMVMWTYAWPTHTTTVSKRTPKPDNDQIKPDSMTMGKEKPSSSAITPDAGKKKPNNVNNDDNATPVKN